VIRLHDFIVARTSDIGSALVRTGFATPPIPAFSFKSPASSDRLQRLDTSISRV
jgi:hypothetical protein